MAARTRLESGFPHLAITFGSIGTRSCAEETTPVTSFLEDPLVAKSAAYSRSVAAKGKVRGLNNRFVCARAQS